ncbi:MAG: hypothetical protein MMC23_000068 [Stictis urceolatum]|nr:hypothetical protein [Stictis urceolata]
MHSSGLLVDIFGSSTVGNITLRQEKESLSDIYDYAARYHCIPDISISQSEKHSRYRARKHRTLYEFRIRMPEHDIDVTAIQKDFKEAEVSAGIMFKQEAERYHSRKGTETLVVNDSNALSVKNAGQFFQFYQDVVDRSQVFTVDVEHTKEFNASQVHLAQGKINGESLGPKIITQSSKALALDIATLCSAVIITNDQPDIIPRFLKALRAGNGQYLRMVSPMNVEVHNDSLDAMQQTIQSAREAGLADEVGELEDEVMADASRHPAERSLSVEEAEERSKELLRGFQTYKARADLDGLRETRAELPMNQYIPKVLNIVDKNIFSIIIGATGSGKTTQVPQILLERAIASGDGASCNVVCTQPRRIAATSVARRVADERAEALGQSVGYNVRFDRKPPQQGGSILYCTTGILLKQLQHSPDEVLDRVSHLVIDEVHERDVIIDFLLNILKKVMVKRIRNGQTTPKVVLMSATIDSQLFSSYFSTSHPELGDLACPTLSVPGRTFPVTEKHLESLLSELDAKYGRNELQLMYNDRPSTDYFYSEKEFAKHNPIEGDLAQESNETVIDWRKKAVEANGELVDATENQDSLVPIGLIATTIAHIAKSTDQGAVLVFLPGLEEMSAVHAMLRDQQPLGVDFKDQDKYKTYMLHSSIHDSQRTVFDAVPPECRKIILATNIAETSITIPDVQYVVDCGKLREKRYDQLRRITKLQCTWISKSNSKQRAGRAGRVQNGHYYALFSKPRLHSLKAIGLPELLRSDLQETCLEIKAQAFKAPVREFLADSIEPPNPVAVATAIENLITLDAFTENEELTALGRLLAMLPCHPSLGKMMVLGMLFRCLDPMVVLGSAASDRSMFLNPLGAREKAKAAKVSFVRGTNSDHIATMNAFNELRYIRDAQGFAAMKDYAQRNFLHAGAFKAIENTAKQIESVLIDVGLIPSRCGPDAGIGGPVYNENSGKVQIVKALALAGFHPNIGYTSNEMLFRTPGEKNCMVHPSSVNGEQFGRNKHAAPDHRSNLREPRLVSFSALSKANDGNATFLKDTTIVEPLTAILFGGHLSKEGRVLEMDGWLRFFIHSRNYSAMSIIMEFKQAMDRMQTEAFRDLSKKKSLADNEVRTIFAKGLHDILNIEKARKQGLKKDLGPPRGFKDTRGSKDTYRSAPNDDLWL